MNEWAAPPPPRKPRRWLRRLAWIAGGLLLLLLLAYFVLTSAPFLKVVILPKVGNALHAAITVEDASLHPFFSVSLSGLEVRTTGPAPLLTAKEVVARYSLWDIIGGKINVREVRLMSPIVTIMENADGTSNLDPLLQSSPEEGKKPQSPSQSSAPPQLEVRNVSLTNATVRRLVTHTNGIREILELAGVNLTLDRLQNGQAGNLALGADLAFTREFPPTQTATNDALQARIAGAFQFVLGADLQPHAINGNSTLQVSKAAGSLADLAGLAAALDCELTATELKQVALSFKQNDKSLGQIRVSGPLELAKSEGKVKIEIAIDRHVLNLAGAMLGMDFGQTTVGATYEVDISKAGKLVAAAGKLNVNQLSITQNGATTKPLDLQLENNVVVDLEAKSAVVNSFALSGTQDQKTLLRGTLTRPMQLSFGGATNATGESAFDLAVTDLNLSNWKPFLGTSPPSGMVGLTLNLVSKQDGKNLSAVVAAQVDDLTAGFGSNRVAGAGVNFKTSLLVDNFKQVTVDNYRLEVTLQKQTALTLSGGAKYDLATQEADEQIELQVLVARLLPILANPQLAATSGAFELSARLAQKPVAGPPGADLQTQVTAKFALTNFSGNLADARLQNFTAAIDSEISLAGQRLQVQRFNGTLSQAAQAGGSFELTGNYDLKKEAGQIALKLANLNQNSLRPFLASALGDKTLASVSVNANTTASYDAKGESSINGGIQITNLLITDPKNQLPKTPLGADLNLDAGLLNDEATVRQLTARIRQGELAGGSLEVGGKYNLKTKLGQLALKLTDLNQDALRPLLASALGPRTLVSVSIDANATAQYDAAGESNIKTDFQLANLVVKDPEKQFPDTPLAIKLQLDSSLNKQVIDLRQLQLVLTPTPRAKNEVQLSAKVDLTNTNAIQGEAKLLADLDLTPYYDLFAAKQKPPPTAGNQPAPKPGTPTKPAPAAPGNVEPAAIRLPVQQFGLDVNLTRLFLRELAISNWLATVKIEGGRVRLNPFRLVLNGAPVNASADLNLAVPGFQYDVTFAADTVPLEPIANTFAPDTRGQYKGDLIATAQIKGAGITGVNLQKNLSGELAFNFTNANIRIASPRLKAFLTPIALLLTAPDLLDSPLNWVGAGARVGNGKINVSQFNLVSESFTADTGGDLPIADVLMDSPINKWPMHFYARRAVAQRIHLLPKGTPPDAKYAKLPDFIKVAGTLGEPKAELNKLALSGALLDKAVDKVPGLKEKLGGINPLDLFKGAPK